jgi:hypothetical protein
MELARLPRYRATPWKQSQRVRRGFVFRAAAFDAWKLAQLKGEHRESIRLVYMKNLNVGWTLPPSGTHLRMSPTRRAARTVIGSALREGREVQGNHRVTIGPQTRPIMAGDSRP